MIKITTDRNIKQKEWFDVMQKTRFTKLIFSTFEKKTNNNAIIILINYKCTILRKTGKYLGRCIQYFSVLIERG